MMRFFSSHVCVSFLVAVVIVRNAEAIQGDQVATPSIPNPSNVVTADDRSRWLIVSGGSSVKRRRHSSHRHLHKELHQKADSFESANYIIEKIEIVEEPEIKNKDSLSLHAMAYMSLLALQFGVQPILTRKFASKEIRKSSVVLTQEIVKFAIAASIFFRKSPEHRRVELEETSVKKWLSIAALPAALYTIQNLLSLHAYHNLKALTFNVLNQTKILSAAMCCFLVLGQKQSPVQLFSLFTLLASALITSGGFSKQAILSSRQETTTHITHGIIPVLLASFISGLAGALTQKNLQQSGMKKNKPRDAYLFSMELSVASIVLLLLRLLWNSDGTSFSHAFEGWTLQTFIPILTNSVGGILVGLVTKHAGSVRKGFSLIFGMFLSGLLQGSDGLTSSQVIGGLLAAASLLLHTSNPKIKFMKD